MVGSDGTDVDSQGSPKRTAKQPALTPDELQAQRDAEREELLAAVGVQDFDTLHKRVAWVLNHYPASRDSDIALQIAYWETFEPDYDGATIQASDLFNFARLTSLARACEYSE